MIKLRCAALLATTLLLLSACSSGDTPNETSSASTENPSASTENPSASTDGSPYNFTQVATGGGHTCAVLDTGGVQCWGSNFSGQIGDGTEIESGKPVDVVGLSAKVVSIAAGDSHTCAVLDTGGAQCWGSNEYGQLGDGTEIYYGDNMDVNDSSKPVDVVGLSSKVVSIAAGVLHTCAVLDTGGVQCWGYNRYGQIGDGTEIDSSKPVDVVGLSSKVVSIAVSSGYLYPGHTCAVLDTGGVQCWGSNRYGQIGDGTKIDSRKPLGVVGLSTKVVSIAAGDGHTCAVLDTGSAQCWGSNSDGQLGDGTYRDSSKPVAVVGLSYKVVSIAAGGSHTCAVLDTGSAQCWGSNDYGQIGDGTTVLGNSDTPVDVVGLSAKVVSIDADGAHTCAVLDTGGVQCWGSNSGGQLGDGTDRDSSKPVAVVGLSSKVVSIDIGGETTCAVLDTGGAQCWGSNEFGQLGDGTYGDSSKPVAVVGLSSKVVSIAAGDNHTCALLEVTGGVQCWGSNRYGQIGDGTEIYYGDSLVVNDSSKPVDVVGLSSKVVSIAAGDNHTCAVLDTGSAQCWGSNSDGQLGDATLTDSSAPVGVSGLSAGVVSIAAGGSHNTCALMSSGGVQCWGILLHEETSGNGDVSSWTPESVPGLSFGVVAIASNGACALMSSGGVQCWGEPINDLDWDTHGGPPVDVSGLSAGVVSIAAGGSHACAVLDTGSVQCWGSNEYGQIGDGVPKTRNTPVVVAKPR